MRRPFDRYRCGGVLRDVRLGRRDPRMLRWQATANSLRFFVAPAIGGACRLPYRLTISPSPVGFDHGVGHSLLLLCDAKAPRGQKCKEFKNLGDYLFKPFMGLS